MMQPTIRRQGHLQTLLQNEDALESVCHSYLMDATLEGAPSVAGLCAILGTTPQGLKALFNQSAVPEEPPDEITGMRHTNGQVSEACLAILASAIMNIEASMVEKGLTGAYNAHVTKFILSAYHNRNEKTLSESRSNSTIKVILESHQPTTIEELEEFQRIEDELSNQAQMERTALGFEYDKNDPENEISDEELLI